MGTKKTIALWQFLLLTKFKICTVLPRNIMAVYEEDELHCYRSTTSKCCLNATYRCLCFALYFWNSPKLLADTCLHRACSPGSRRPGTASLYVLGQTGPQASGVANTCLHRACSPGSRRPGTASLYVLGQTWSQSQVLPIHVLMV